MSDTSSPPSPPTPLFYSSSNSSSSSRCTTPSLQGNSIDATVKWLVQTYSVTSISEFAVKIAEDIVLEHLCDHKIAVICSAQSRSANNAGTMDLLLRAAEEALRRPVTLSETATRMVSTGPFSQNFRTQSPIDTPRISCESDPSETAIWPVVSCKADVPAFQNAVEVIRAEHLSAARASVKDASILHEVEAEINQDCDELGSYLLATQIIDEISPRSRDCIVAFGERLACRIVTAVLQDRGIDADFVNLEDIMPPPHGDGALQDPDTLTDEFYDRVAVAIEGRIKQCGSRVPVVSGFFGPVPGSLLRQVGQGYTDLLAALLAAGVGASELQIWKEVDGIFTADPCKVPTARLIPTITPEEAAELTQYGSEVVHPFTLEQARRKKIPIRIKNVEKPRGQGTVIHSDQGEDTSPTLTCAKSLTCPSMIACPQLPYNPFSNPVLPSSRDARFPIAVTVKEGIVVLSVSPNRKNVSHGFLAKVFGTLDRYGVVVDLITTSSVHVIMTIEQGLDKRVLGCVTRELQKSGTVDVRHDMAVLSLVGQQMRYMVGIAGQMLTALGKRGVNVEMISQGASEINISCVIHGRDAMKAINLIHQSCLQPRTPGYGV